MQQELESLLSRHGVPTRNDIERLNDQIEALTKQLDGVIDARRSNADEANPAVVEEST